MEKTLVVDGIAINLKALHDAAKFMVGADKKIKGLASSFLTAEVMGNKGAREAARKELGRFMVAELGTDAEYARTAWYRMVKYAGFTADGKPLNQEADKPTQGVEVAADSSLEAWIACYKSDNWSGAQAIIRARKAAKRDAAKKAA